MSISRDCPPYLFNRCGQEIVQLDDVPQLDGSPDTEDLTQECDTEEDSNERDEASEEKNN